MMHKNILIVGASKGIGAELVSQFSTIKSMHVIALARNIESVNNWNEKENVSVHNFDLTSLSMKEDLSVILTKYSQIDYVVNNLSEANFDPEFFKHFENEILNTYNQTSKAVKNEH